jgi:hypothetical protein
MKKIIAFLSVIFVISSCTLDDATQYKVEALPIVNVEIPTEFELGETYPITMRYRTPTSCHSFKNIIYEKHLNERTIAIESLVRLDNNCIPTLQDAPLSETTFNFKVTSNGSYIFKFWQGQNQQGENVFLEIEVPVLE